MAPGRALVVLCVLLASASLITTRLSAAALQTPIKASVTVVSPSAESYGASVSEAHRCHNADAALGPADGDGAVLWNGGQITVEMASTTLDCRKISIWTSRAGWGSAGFIAHVSGDGRSWTHIGSVKELGEYGPYDFSGDFGSVRYVRVTRTGGWFALVFLDAIAAKGGDV